MERSKSISVRSINKIKNLKRKIFEYEDEEPGDWYEGDESFSSMFGEDNYD